MDESERWEPDDALVFTVRTRVLPIGNLSGPDRAWIVASLTIQGWTVASIAGRLKCSLRLIQQIKAEPLTVVAMYALGLQRQLVEERSLRRLECLAASQTLAETEHAVGRLTRQRDALLDRMVELQKEVGHGSKTVDR